MAQQILGEQHADHVVAVLIDHGEARVRGADHLWDELVDRLVDVDHVHARARDHDVAHLRLGHRERALDDRQRVGVEQVPLVGRAQQARERGAVRGLAQQQRREALEQTGSGGAGHRGRDPYSIAVS